MQILGKESLDGATSAWPEGWLSLGRLHLAWQALADLMDLSLPAASAGAGATPRALIACPRRGSTPDGACLGAFGACVQPGAELWERGGLLSSAPAPHFPAYFACLDWSCPVGACSLRQKTVSQAPPSSRPAERSSPPPSAVAENSRKHIILPTLRCVCTQPSSLTVRCVTSRGHRTQLPRPPWCSESTRPSLTLGGP